MIWVCGGCGSRYIDIMYMYAHIVYYTMDNRPGKSVCVSHSLHRNDFNKDCPHGNTAENSIPQYTESEKGGVKLKVL